MLKNYKKKQKKEVHAGGDEWVLRENDSTDRGERCKRSSQCSYNAPDHVHGIK